MSQNNDGLTTQGQVAKKSNGDGIQYLDSCVLRKSPHLRVPRMCRCCFTQIAIENM